MEMHAGQAFKDMGLIYAKHLCRSPHGSRGPICSSVKLHCLIFNFHKWRLRTCELDPSPCICGRPGVSATNA